MAADYQQYPLVKGELPPGWVETTVGEVLSEVRSGYASGRHNQTGQGIAHLRPMNVSPDGEIAMKELRYVAPSAGRLRLAEGDVLFTNTSSTFWVGKTAFVEKVDDWGFSNHMTRLRVAEGMSAEFVARQLHFLCLSGYFASLCKKHINQSSVSKTQLMESVPFRLPPAKEQERIAMALRRLLVRVYELRSQLESLPGLIQQYRAAIFEAACTGRLVPTEAELARDKGSECEPSADLLARLLAERRAEWERQELARLEVGGRKPGDDRWKERYREPKLPAVSPLSKTLPPGWQWVSVDQCGAVQLGRQRSPAHHTGNNMRRYLRVANVYEDRLDLSDVKQMNFTPEEYEIFRLEPYDILLNEGQSLDLIGRPAMYHGEIEEVCFQNTLIRFRPLPSLVPEYALAVFRHYLHAKRFKEVGRIVTNLAHIGTGRFAGLEFPLPPYAEQQRIVQKLAQCLGTIANIELQVTASLKRTSELRMSLLDRAMSGMLVPQAVEDEPAENLLSRISATKEQHRKNFGPSKSRDRMQRTKQNRIIPFAQELLSAAEEQFGDNSFTFAQLAPHLAADYERAKIEVFELLAATQGPRLKQVFNPKSTQIEIQQIKP